MRTSPNSFYLLVLAAKAWLQKILSVTKSASFDVSLSSSKTPSRTRFSLKLLTFEQRVNASVFCIVVLLLISGVASLHHLLSVKNDSAQVNERALPILNWANVAQIELLQQAKATALAYSKDTLQDVEEQHSQFVKNEQEYLSAFENLSQFANADQDFSARIVEINRFQTIYSDSSKSLFDAKLSLLRARHIRDGEHALLLSLLDDIGAALVELMYYKAEAQHTQKMEVVAGFASGADDRLMPLLNILDVLVETRNASDLPALENDIGFIVSDSFNFFDKGKNSFLEFGDADIADSIDSAYQALSQRLSTENNLLEQQYQIIQYSQVVQLQLEEANLNANFANASFNDLRSLAEKQFNVFKLKVDESVNLGMFGGVVLTIILISLASRLFKSMKETINSKVDDLRELNHLGQLLASSVDNESSINATLQSLRAKWQADSTQVFRKTEDGNFVTSDGEEQAERRTAEVLTSDDMDSLIEGDSEKRFHIDYVNEPNPSTRLMLPLVQNDETVGLIWLTFDHRQLNFSESEREYLASVSGSLTIALRAIRLRELIEEQNRDLEKTVLNRTSALIRKNQDIANMLANLNQGLFTIKENGTIHDEYASFMETIFETHNIAQRNFSELLFQQSDLSPDFVEQNKAAVDVILGQDVMFYEFNQTCLAKELNLHLANDRQKVLELDWCPILVENTVESLMVTVRDVSKERHLEAEARSQKLELQMIAEILAITPQKFIGFINNTHSELKKCCDIVAQAQDCELPLVQQIYQKLHTLKGNARTYDFKELTRHIHEVEEYYSSIIKGDERDWQPDKLIAELIDVQSTTHQYNNIFSEKLRGTADAQLAPQIETQKLAKLAEELKVILKESMSENVRTVLSRLHHQLNCIDAKHIDEILKDIMRSIGSIARQLNKAEPQINIEHGDILFYREVHGLLHSVFVHLIRNALDHGIESSQERRKKGKSISGAAYIKAGKDGDFIELSVADDGRGIELDKLYRKGLEKSLFNTKDDTPSPDDVANLVFLDGLSTAKALTDISGRGVGMSAVKASLKEIGATINIQLGDTLPSNTDDFKTAAAGINNIEIAKNQPVFGVRQFMIIIRIPNKYGTALSA